MKILNTGSVIDFIAHAADMAGTTITRSQNSGYTNNEQVIINQALKILASKMINQDSTFLITSSQAAKDFIQLKIANSPREIFAVLFLDNSNRVIDYEEMFVGTLDRSSVWPREIAKRALELNAKNLILAHNHPSGALKSSQDDDVVTQNITQCVKVFDIKVLDHLIVTKGGVLSYSEQGKMF